MTKRTGASLLQTINDAPTATICKLGFTTEHAARMIRTRQVLPLLDDPKSPQIDARKLWTRIGKPHRQFRDWAAHYIKPLLDRPPPFAEISSKATPVKTGRPRQDYTLSRDVAAHLAMQANTPEGADIRDYFLDMERLALRLSEHMGVRVTTIVGTDNKLTHTLTRRAAEQIKAGRVTGTAKVVALGRERALKAVVCEVLTGRTPTYWRDTFKVKSLRDVLDTGDATHYSQCYECAWAAVNAGLGNKDKLVAFLTPSYGGKVSPVKYAALRLKTHGGRA